MERLGDILLLERLAAGGMAEVFRAKQYGHGGFEKVVAVKRILPHIASSEEFRAMFRQEANLSAQLQHPNIAQVYSNGNHGDYFYIVMEFVDGKSLKEVLMKYQDQGKLLPIEFVCFAISEAAKGLDFAHNFVDEKTGQPLNIVHRDVSHHNVMMSYDGAVKIVDFGVAKVTDGDSNKTRAGVLKGKLSYMSPEQVRGRPVDRRTDVFSLGILLWELLTGRSLFGADTELGTLEQIRECYVPDVMEYNPKVSERLNRIVKKALEKEVSARYSSARELQADLQRYLNEFHTSYFQSDVTEFLKGIFKEEIFVEKIKKDRLNREAQKFLLRESLSKGNDKSNYEAVAERSISKLVFHSAATPAPLKTHSVIRDPMEYAGFSRYQQAPLGVSVKWEIPNARINTGSFASRPRFEYEHSDANSHVYSRELYIHYIQLILVLVVLSAAVGYFWFKEQQKVLYASSGDGHALVWTSDFREVFLESCELTIASKFNKTQLCYCLEKPVERSHILASKYNPNLMSDEARNLLRITTLKKYFKSSEGQRAIASCEEDLGKY